MTDRAKFRVTLVIAAVMLMVGFGAWLVISPPGLCGNDVLSEKTSPSGNWRAVVFERSCGATTGFSTQASVLKKHERLEDTAGNVIVPERAWDLKWASDRELVVQYSKYYPPARKTAYVGDVQVTYEQLQ